MPQSHPKLLPPDTFHFSAAIGWLELGNPAEAIAELDNLSPLVENHPDVLEVRWQICAEQQKWDSCRHIAKVITDTVPTRTSGWINLAYAARRATGGTVEQTAEILLLIADKFPKETIIPFNLACYLCQLNQLDDARQWLTRAFERSIAANKLSEIRAMALEEKDLRPLWKEIKANLAWITPPKK